MYKYKGQTAAAHSESGIVRRIQNHEPHVTMTYHCILIAFILDLAMADPRWFPHPVRIIGKTIQALEWVLRRIRIPEQIAGVFLAMIVVAFTYTVTALLVYGISMFGDIYRVAVCGVVIYFTISLRGLTDEALNVAAMLDANDLDGARQTLAGIVGRDTANMSSEQVKRACIESVAENMVDGVISPLFFAFIGGPPLAMAYKAVNTLDSMVGYRNERYLRLGWASARLDDAANLVPARISVVLIPIAAAICRANPINAIRIGWRDGQKHPSPNSGIPEAMIAGALGIQLGGTAVYNGVVSQRPLIGNQEEPLSVKTIEKTVQIVSVCSFLAVISGIALFLP